MTQTPFRTLRATVASLIAKTRHQTIRESTRIALAPFGPALRDDLGLTCHRQLITFQNAKHQKHSFD